MAAPVNFSLLNPDWLAHRYLESEQAFRYIYVPRSDRLQVPFLTDDCLGERAGGTFSTLTDILATLPNKPLHWVFHSAFCGSTLLTHGLDYPGVTSSLSEPVLLNDVVGLRRRGADRREIARVSDGVLRVLGRTYRGETGVVVKPSNVANPLAELFLALQPEARAVFLFAPLETFLISVARKGLACRLWVRELLEGYLREDFVHLGFTPADYFRQTDLQVAAVGWLAQHAYFCRLAHKIGGGRLVLLDADRMVEQPDFAIDAVSRHFCLGLSKSGVDAIVSGPAFRSHSKSGAAYSATQRRADYAAARASYGEEIDTVLAWAERVAETAGISLMPTDQLIDRFV